MVPDKRHIARPHQWVGERGMSDFTSGSRQEKP